MKKSGLSFLKKITALTVIVAGISIVSGSFVFIKYLRPRMISVTRNFAENRVSMIIDSEIKRLMLREFLSYDKIAIINRDKNGRVTSVSANSVLINNFANELDIEIGDKIDDVDLVENKVYLSALLGMDFLTGMGPKVPVRFQPVSVTHADVTHTFEEAGINQTIHTINLCVSVEIEVLMPFAYSRMDVVSEMPIAQTLIVGTVPDAYLNRNK